MKKLFLAVSSMIVTGFLMKSYMKMKNCEKPETKEEVYRRMKVAHEVHSKLERLLADARATFNRMDVISTPRDGEPMSLIDSFQQMSRGGSHD